MKLSPCFLSFWTALPVVAADCAVYTVKAGDTCTSIGRANNATYAQLLAWNSEINIQCSNMGDFTGSELCLSNPLGDYAIPTNSRGSLDIVTTIAPVPTPTPNQTNSRCAEYYVVEAGQDCGTVTMEFEITLRDFLFLNPHVWENCTNLWHGYYYCVKPVGYLTTYPGYGGSPTTDHFEQIPSTPLPDPGPGNRDPFANYSSSFPVIPLANGTRRDCHDYIWFDNITDNAATDCWGLAMVVGASAEEFILWNPSLGENSTSVGSPLTTMMYNKAMTTVYSNAYAYPCTLSANSSYCVRVASPTSTTAQSIKTPSPRANGEIANCTAWYALDAEWSTCQILLDSWNLTIEQFYAMNPSVKDDCTGLVLGTYYCLSTYPGGAPVGQPDGDGPTTTTTPPSSSTTGVTTSTPIQTGMVKNCDEFYFVLAGDTCYDIAQDSDIGLDEFYGWNPAVRDDCSGLQAAVYVCVGVDTGTTITAPPTSTSGVPTPTPTQPGMMDNCGKFYFVQPGDGCYELAVAEGIALADFYTWNPAVKSDCSGLQANVYVCVGLL